MAPFARWIFLVMFLAVPRAGAGQTDSLRCEQGLVSLGAETDEVEDACGAPAFVDQMQAAKIVRTYQRTRTHGRHEGEKGKGDKERDLERDYRLLKEERTVVRLEEWTYNFGSSRFIQTLAFEDGQLSSIATGSYGFDHIPNEGSLVEKGDSKAIVFMKYGKAARWKVHPGTVAHVRYQDQGPYLYEIEIERPAVEEEWTYDFGPDKFLQRLVFKNNRLVDIRSLERRGTRHDES